MRAAPTVVHGCRAAGNPCTIFDCSGAADVGSPMVRPHLGAGGPAPAAAIACFSSLPSPPPDVNMPEAAVVPERRGVHLWHEEVQLSAGFVGETESSSGAFEVAPVVPASWEAASQAGPDSQGQHTCVAQGLYPSSDRIGRGGVRLPAGSSDADHFSKL